MVPAEAIDQSAGTLSSSQVTVQAKGSSIRNGQVQVTFAVSDCSMLIDVLVNRQLEEKSGVALIICGPKLIKVQEVEVDGPATHCDGHHVTDSAFPPQVAAQEKALPVNFSLSQVMTRSERVLSVILKEVSPSR